MLGRLAAIVVGLWVGIPLALGIAVVVAPRMRELLELLRHWRAHRTGSNVGHLVTWRARDGRLMVGYFCSGCAAVTGIHAMPDHVTRPAKREAR